MVHLRTRIQCNLIQSSGILPFPIYPSIYVCLHQSIYVYLCLCLSSLSMSIYVYLCLSSLSMSIYVYLCLSSLSKSTCVYLCLSIVHGGYKPTSHLQAPSCIQAWGLQEEWKIIGLSANHRAGSIVTVSVYRFALVTSQGCDDVWCTAKSQDSMPLLNG